MINKIKDSIYCFFKQEMAIAFPLLFPLDDEGFSEKIFWKKNRGEEPVRPYIVLNDVIKGKTNRAHETYRRVSDNKLVKRENWMMMVTFGVCSQSTEGNLATSDRQATDVVEYIQDLFNSTETFSTLLNGGIIIDEKQVSNIRDLSSFEDTNYVYRYEIDVTFNFDIIKESIDYGVGQGIQYEVSVKNSEVYIQNEIGD